MLPPLNASGTLPPGVHWADWDDVQHRFGSTEHRRRLLAGLRAALAALKIAGCRALYLDGSFVTSKATPNDYDACWDVAGVDPKQLDPVLLTFDPGRMLQKAKYGGELFPASWAANQAGQPFLNFFQVDKLTGDPKGIVAINLDGWKI